MREAPADTAAATGGMPPGDLAAGGIAGASSPFGTTSGPAQREAAAAPPSPPARQVAPIAVALAFAPNPAGGFTLQLDPAQLGRVEVTVSASVGGGDRHRVTLVAERPETLALLQRDRADLDRALAGAGLMLEAGGVAFSLAGDGGAGHPGGDPHGAANGGQGRGGPRSTTADPAPTAPTAPPRAARGLLDLHA